MKDHLPANMRQMVDSIDASNEGEHTPAFKPGDDFGRYIITRFIGCGGMAEVYEAEHLGLRKRVALKVLTAEMAQNGVVRSRFLREGERAARIRHPHVVDITDVGEGAGLPYIVMEYLEGETLGDMLLREAPLALEQIVNVMLPVMSAVSAGHLEGVIHRDLKPDNIFLHRDGRRVRPKVLDFGVSRSVGEQDVTERRLTVPHAVLGTPQYMAPEQARGEDADERADQYTLALVLYEAVTNELPREGDTILQLLNAAASGKLTLPTRYAPQLEAEFEAVLMRALHPKPDARYEQLIDFAKALLPWASSRARDYWTTEFSKAGTDSPQSYDPLALASDPGSLEGYDLDTGNTSRPRAVPFTQEAPALRALAPAAEAQAHTLDPSFHTLSNGPTTMSAAPARSWAPAVLLAAIAAAGLTAYAVVTLTSKSDVEAPAATQQVQPADPVTPTAQLPASAVTTTGPAALHITVSPADAKIYIDDAFLASGTYEGKLPADGRTYNIRAEAPGHVSQLKIVQASGDLKLDFALSPTPTSPRRGSPLPNVEPTKPAPAPAAAEPSDDFVRRNKRKSSKDIDKNNPYK